MGNSKYEISKITIFILVQPTGTLGDECCCPSRPTLTLTRSWRNISPPKTCRPSETLSSLSRQRHSVLFSMFIKCMVLFLKVTLSSYLEIVGCFFKGLGEMPQDTQSARGRRSLPGSGTVRASSLTREPLNQTNRWV